MALTKKQRNLLADDQFAVPETRDLPIHDKSHVKMAWGSVSKTKGLSAQQRLEAKARIIAKAKELGIDTSAWKNIEAAPDANEPDPSKGNLNDINADNSNAYEDEVSEDEKENLDMEKQMEEKEDADKRSFQGLSLSALALEFPEAVKDHPNQAPFKGVLTKLDEPSDAPLGGSNGKRVILPTEIAEESLPSLIGMAVDYTPNFDGHDVKSKIGLITEANIVNNEIHIAGFFYSADFPKEVKRIQAEKANLGFSFEAQVHIRSMNDNPLIIKNCIFTGAAVLYKDKAAYTTTSLSAQKMEIDEMTPELKEMLDAIRSEIADMKTKMEASADDKAKLSAGSVLSMVQPHVDALRACASNMQAAGFGMHESMGHVAVLNRMADSMQSDAVLGKLPHIYQVGGWYGASADKNEDEAKTVVEAAKAELTDKLAKVTESLAVVESKLVDSEKARFAAAAEPERKTLTPAIINLLAKAGITNTSSDSKISLADLNKKLEGTKMSNVDRMAVKLSMQEAGQIES